jgi:hypothetical protein
MERKGFSASFSSQEGQVLSWVLSIITVAIILGVLIIQTGPIIANHISLRGTANEIANYAAREYRRAGGNLSVVEESVEEHLEDKDVRLAGEITVREEEDGKLEIICVPVRKIVNTYLFKNISYLAPLTEAQVIGESNVY